MKVDLLYEMQRPGRHDERTEYELYWDTMAEIELADEAGFSTVWTVEHHFLRGFAHSSAPEVFLSSAAQRTKNIRLGHGVVLLPHKFNHPIRVAERIGALDILSNGRVEFGTGRSAPYEQEPFGIDPAESRDMFQEALEIIPRMWMNPTFSYEGRYFSIPERHVIPKPIQKPHPPIWMACSSPASWQIAGRNGVGALGLTLLVEVDEVKEYIASYGEALEHARPVGGETNDQVGAFTIVHCGESDEEARDAGSEAAAWYINRALSQFAAPPRPDQPSGNGLPPPKRRDNDAAYETFRAERRERLLERVLDRTVGLKEFSREDMIIVGDPDTCTRKLLRYRDAGIERVLCIMQAGHLPHEKTMESIRLFGKYVIPNVS